jgi:hypothetical protein
MLTALGVQSWLNASRSRWQNGKGTRTATSAGAILRCSGEGNVRTLTQVPMRSQGVTLRDREIRSALRSKLRALHAQDPDTAIIDELSLCQGESRIDVAVVNSSLGGYEIKSDRDTLTRLARQSETYALCFDTLTVVVGGHHVRDCEKRLPYWWGIWEAVRTPDAVKIESRREPQKNPKVSPDRLVQLLWKNELIESLGELGLTAPPKAQRRELWAVLASGSPPGELSRIVRDRIRARGDWRSAPTPFRCGGSSRSVASSQRCRKNRRWLLSQRFQRRPD